MRITDDDGRSFGPAGPPAGWRDGMPPADDQLEIYVFAAHHFNAGTVVPNPEDFRLESGKYSTDVELFGEGTRDDLIDLAESRLAQPGQSAPIDFHANRCARMVLDHLDNEE